MSNRPLLDPRPAEILLPLLSQADGLVWLLRSGLCWGKSGGVWTRSRRPPLTVLQVASSSPPPPRFPLLHLLPPPSSWLQRSAPRPHRRPALVLQDLQPAAGAGRPERTSSCLCTCVWRCHGSRRVFVSSCVTALLLLCWTVLGWCCVRPSEQVCLWGWCSL